MILWFNKHKQQTKIEQKRKTMLNKLLSNLPFNPSLIGQVAFYGKRLKQESSVRRVGFVFMALTLFVQMFAVIAPPQPSVAASGNDIVPGGFSSQSQAVAACNGNQHQLATIINHFGVSCQDLVNGSVRRIDYSEQGGRLRSIGRFPYGFSGEQAHSIGGVGTVYSRPLTSWGPHCYNDGKGCQAIVGNSSRGQFMLLFSCGNLVFVNPPAPPPAPKAIQCANLIINVTPGSRVPINSIIGVRGQANGQNLPPGELVDMYYDYFKVENGQIMASDLARGVPFGGAGNSTATDPTTRTFRVTEPGHYRFRLIVKYDGSSKIAAGSDQGNCVRDVYVDRAPEPPKPDACPYNPNVPKDSPQCKPCEKSDNPEDLTACLILSKKASNDTQNIDDANNTTANAGDTITYTLTVENTSQETLKKFVVEENIGDILEYADVTDYHGGVKDSNNIVKWPATDIKAGGSISKQITVKVKDPIPQTPASATNPGSYDLVMTNVYGNTVNIKLPGSVAKTTEQVATTLPNTGPGTNIAIGFAITAVAGYFLARSRLLAKEIDIVRTEYAAGA